ncbi:hypothetical protein [Pseudomonas sp. NPDC089547]|uniref:hypothetical protein n=1 Tax=Pseudomonas sp. NPDC089547 TaxID=3390652 RepID=UPI003CFEB4D0
MSDTLKDFSDVVKEMMGDPSKFDPSKPLNELKIDLTKFETYCDNNLQDGYESVINSGAVRLAMIRKVLEELWQLKALQGKTVAELADEANTYLKNM